MENRARGSMGSSPVTPRTVESGLDEKSDAHDGNANRGEQAVNLNDEETPHRTRDQENRSHLQSRPAGRLSQDGRSLKLVRSHHSRAGGDGYTCFEADPDPPCPNKSNAGEITGEPYLVSWDGDADPENPRSMGMLRRWAIVLICAASSLCVYVQHSLLTHA